MFLLNVDLDIDSTDDLTPLLEAFEPHAYSLERPPGMASFELNEPVSPNDPEALILAFVGLVNNLPPAARQIWNGAAHRVFDIGIQSQRQPHQKTYRLSTSTLRAAADVGAEIAITVYALVPPAEE